MKTIVRDIIASENDQLRSEEITVIKYLESNANITRKDVKEILSIGETKIKDIFNVLIEKGLIQRHGSGRSTYYTGIYN